MGSGGSDSAFNDALSGEATAPNPPNPQEIQLDELGQMLSNEKQQQMMSDLFTSGMGVTSLVPTTGPLLGGGNSPTTGGGTTAPGTTVPIVKR